jgi:hypothetical protein
MKSISSEKTAASSAPLATDDAPERIGTPRRETFLFALAAALIPLIVFSPVLRHGFVDVWDDDTAITHNPDFNPPRLSSLLHYWVPPPKDQFYVPVTYTVLGLTAMAARSTAPGGAVIFNPAPFHAINMVAHALSAMLVFLILVQLVRGRWAAFAGAIVFALHPIQTEAVAWASTSYTPMCGVFSLASVWQFLRYSENLTQKNRGVARMRYAVASLFFVLAMLTKPAAASVPLILAAIEIFWRGRRAISLVLPLGVWLVLAIPVIVATKMGAPANTVGHFELWQRIIVALDAVAFYLWKIVWPVHLSADYGRSPNSVLANPLGWWTCAIPVALVAIAWLLRKREPWFGAALGVFVAALLPTLGFASFDFQTFSTVADRFAYLAMLGIGIVVAVLLARLSYRLVVSAAVAAVGGLGLLCNTQLPHWQNAWTLFAHTIETRPQSRIVGSNIGFMLTPELEARCTLPPAQLTRLGDLLLNQRRSGQAAAVYEMAIARGSRDAASYVRLATALLQSERLADAELAAQQALQIDPDEVAAYVTLGNIYIRTDVERAVKQYKKALSIDPLNAAARRGLAATGENN